MTEFDPQLLAELRSKMAGKDEALRYETAQDVAWKLKVPLHYVATWPTMRIQK